MIKIDGMEEEIEKLEKISGIYSEELMKEANGIGLDVRDDIRANTPVDTGVLRESTFFDGAEKKSGYIEIKNYNNTPYAENVEYGHRQEVGRYVPAIGKRLKKPFVKGYYMFRNAENNIQTELDERLYQAIRRADDRLND